jgi:hypothetical protein
MNLLIKNKDTSFLTYQLKVLKVCSCFHEYDEIHVSYINVIVLITGEMRVQI